MWLLDCSNYRLEPNNLDSDQGNNKYWILSHTWGRDEVTFHDMQDLSRTSQKKGFRKIEAMCQLAPANGPTHVWIDTCCIDKTSSAELSEAINFMFYCPAPVPQLEEDLQKCRWFTRGWTLQELLAPSEVEFDDGHWNPRGTKRQLCAALFNISGIPEMVLMEPHGPDNNLQSVPTTRLEDEAYSLLGIFDMHMPLLYGEREQAFIRLQQTIAQKVNDMSLFAWIADPLDALGQPSTTLYSGLLASDPSQFSACTGIAHIRDPLLPSPSWIITNAGIEITTALAWADSEHTIITRGVDNSIKTKPGYSKNLFCTGCFPIVNC
ncbi:hypothetical protein N657DRAFT_655407 [Parathielavia appendiculata]|uniref:Heterokaryon incompatibility domain-containing protein n=1 Tax=Parathielavia appendiculata TaxID=2587402 RepID=A0AAN6U2L1_9PEZI|nr:hypothetical protein N657DRAFT_655407 [Parathielavia appendiculata]